MKKLIVCLPLLLTPGCASTHPNDMTPEERAFVEQVETAVGPAATILTGGNAILGGSLATVAASVGLWFKRRKKKQAAPQTEEPPATPS